MEGWIGQDILAAGVGTTPDEQGDLGPSGGEKAGWNSIMETE